MRKQLNILFLFCFALFTQAQVINRPFIWFGPCDSVNVHGLNFTPFVYRIPEKVTVNGINFEIIGLPIFLFMIPEDPSDRDDELYILNEFNVNGISLSPAGLMHSGKVNGLAITPLYSFIHQVNGINLSLLFCITLKTNGLSYSFVNSAVEMKGVQLGMVTNSKKILGLQMGVVNKTRELYGLQFGFYNRTKQIKGLQIGLWNVNDKRSLPILNW